MTLRELIEAVNEKNLTKTQLEEYRDQMSHVAALLHLEYADLEKKEALFIDSCTEPTDIAKKRKWKITIEGQRQIEVKGYIKSAEKMLSSLKSRLFSMY